VNSVSATFTIYDGSSDVAMFEVTGGAAYVAGSKVRTESMGLNTVTQGDIDEQDSSASVTTSWTALADVALTVPDATTVVKLDWSIYIDTSGDPEDALEVRIKRGSTVIYETIAITVPPMISFFVEPDQQFDIPQRFNGQFGGFDSDTPGSSGSYTYYLEARSAYGLSAWGVSKRRFAGMQFKR